MKKGKYFNITTEELNKVKIGKLTESEFAICFKSAKKQEFSQFAVFNMALKGYDIYKYGTKIARWEAFLQCSDPFVILNNKTELKAVKKEIYKRPR